MSVFTDTSALYALLVRTEEGHSHVAEAFRELIHGGRRLVTTNYVLVETSALLQRRIGLDAIRDLESRVLPLLEVRWMTELLHRRAMDRLVRTDRRHVSLVDCASFVVMEEEGIREALALGEDFSREGFSLLPDLGKLSGHNGPGMG